MLIYIIIAAFVMSYAWGMRGTPLGHGKGAMLPGALLGIFTAKVLGADNWLLFAAVGACGMYLGGGMTYGQTIGLALDGTRAGFAKGMSGLALKGFLWFSVAAAYLCLFAGAFLSESYSAVELIVAALAPVPLCFLGEHLLNRPHDPKAGRLPKLYFSSTRPESWGGYLFLFLGLAALFIARGDLRSLAVSVLGGAGGAIGWFIGNTIQYYTKFTSRRGKYFLDPLTRRGMVGGWKAMECTIGFFGGLCTLLGFRLIYEAPAAEPRLFAMPETVLTVLFWCYAALTAVCLIFEVLCDLCPPYLSDLRDRLDNGHVRREEFDRLAPTALRDGERPLCRLFTRFQDGIECFIYVYLPMLLCLLGSERTAQFVCVFLITWMVAKRMMLFKYADFSPRWPSALLLVLGSAGSLALSLWSGFASWEYARLTLLLVLTFWYTLLVAVEDLRPRVLRELRASDDRLKLLGAKTLTLIWFFVWSAAALWL